MYEVTQYLCNVFHFSFGIINSHNITYFRSTVSNVLQHTKQTYFKITGTYKSPIMTTYILHNKNNLIQSMPNNYYLQFLFNQPVFF